MKLSYDTNFIIRHLTGDDTEQTARVAKISVSEAKAGRSVFLTLVVLCETVWVLRSLYGFNQRTIAEALEHLLNDPLFEVERLPLVWDALDRFKKGKGDFADYVICGSALSAGVKVVFTFDRSLRREEGFRVLN